jgi:hypothetical protein
MVLLSPIAFRAIDWEHKRITATVAAAKADHAVLRIA